MLVKHAQSTLGAPLRLARGMALDSSSRPSRPPRFRSDASAQEPSSPRAGAPDRNRVQPRKPSTAKPLHLLTLADLSPDQIAGLIVQSIKFKHLCKSFPTSAVRQSLSGKTIALLFNKRSTRTRVASETATHILGGNPMFLGSADIQLGVNESLMDSAKVIGSMADGFMARVGDHREIAELAEHSPVPVVNALSYLWHPTQILADLMTLYEAYTEPLDFDSGSYFRGSVETDLSRFLRQRVDPLSVFKGKKIAWVGDMNNISWELMATCPRMGMEMSVAAPAGYDKIDDAVMSRLKEHGIDQSIHLTNSPKEALHNADIVVTDTWISMGMEAEKEARLKAFEGYQVTNEMVEAAGAKADWKFLHCLPRKQEEVDDEVFYGPRSLVFPEAENRKWTTLGVFSAYFGKGEIPTTKNDRAPPRSSRVSTRPSGQENVDRREFRLPAAEQV